MATTAVNVYKKALVANFRFLKASRDVREAYLRAIPVADAGFLVPIGESRLDDADLLAKLTRWRNEHVHVYPTQFEATVDSTRAWLKERLLATDDRILFLVEDRHGRAVGHIGFNGCLNDERLFEIDNVVRGDAAGAKGLFSLALQALIEWARTTSNVEGFFLRVMDDNPRAIAFYARNGFAEERRIPLVGERRGETLSYREARDGEAAHKHFVRMAYRRTHEAGRSMILTAGPSISAREAVYAHDAAAHGWNRNWSKYLTSFEAAFADYVGVKHAIATSSCTGALQISLMALGIGAGDEVIVPDLTWVATANAVRYVGATPVFADIELDSWNLDARSLDALITPQTKAVIAVHMYGHPARMDAILEVAGRHGLKVIEDAAPAIGAEWRGRRCGSFGDFAAFSFQGAKLLVTGEGGMLATDDDALYEKALKIWDQGRNPSRTFWIDGDGVKFKMSNVQAAVGLGQLERADELIEMKRRIFDWYDEGLAGAPGIALNREIPDARSIYWMTSLRLDESAPIGRDDLMKALKARNVDTRPVFPAISSYPIWSRRQPPQPTASRVGQQAMNLPSGVCLSKDDVFYVCRQVRDLLGA